MSKESYYDATLLGILQNEGEIAKFLDVVMGFLCRRTDFYHVMKTKDEKLGFPPGVAPRLLIQSYEKYEKVARNRDDSKDNRTIIPSRPTNQTDLKNKTAAEVLNPQPSNKASDVLEKGEPSSAETSNKEVKSETQAAFQDNPESHNGAIRDGYRWAQTINDADLRIQVPATITKAKQVKVCIKRKHLTASHLDERNQTQLLIDSDLPWDINVEESMWSLIPKECIHINVEKVQERWWEHMLVDEPKINTRNIESAVPMEHLDEASHSVIDQLMYDERQKKLGLPTSKEQSVQETLRKAWDAEGSPFKGTAYDPSLVDISGGNNS